MIHNIANQPYMQTAAINIEAVKPSNNQVAQTIPSTESEVNPLKKSEYALHKRQQIFQTRQQTAADKLHQLEHKKIEAMQKKLDAEHAQQRLEKQLDSAVKIINSYLAKAGYQVIPKAGSAAWHQAIVGEKKKLCCFGNSDHNNKNYYERLNLNYDKHYQKGHIELVKARYDKERAEQIYRSADQQITLIKQEISVAEKELEQFQVRHQQQQDVMQPALQAIAPIDNDVSQNADTDNRFLAPTKSAKKFDVYMHHTDEENLDSIHKKGLYPAGPSGRQKGIGDENGNCCPDGVYVVQPGKAICDPRSAIALVVSTTSPQRDVNYRNGEAGIFYPKNETNNLPPVREAKEGQCQSTYSLTLPITPETHSGLDRLLQPNNINEKQDASHLVLEKFKKNFPIWGLDKNLCKTVSEKHVEENSVVHADENSIVHADTDSIFDYDSL